MQYIIFLFMTVCNILLFCSSIFEVDEFYTHLIHLAIKCQIINI